MIGPSAATNNGVSYNSVYTSVPSPKREIWYSFIMQVPQRYLVIQSPVNTDNISGMSTTAATHPLSLKSLELLQKLAKSIFLSELWPREQIIGVKRVAVEIRKYAEGADGH